MNESTEPLDELHLHRLLVALDGSPSAELALRAALTAATRDHAAITLLVVVPDMMASASRLGLAGGADPLTLQADADTEAQTYLRSVIERLPESVPVKTLIRRGKPGPEICRHAAEQADYDAILVGARGLGRVGALTGSVSNYVLHHADAAVIVVHPARDAARG